MNHKKRYFIYILIILLVLQTTCSEILSVDVFAMEPGMEENINDTEEVTTEVNDTTTEDNNDSGNPPVTENLQSEEPHVVTYNDILNVTDDYKLTEDTIVQRLDISSDKTLDLNGFTLTITESDTFNSGNIIFHGGKLICEKDCSFKDKAVITMKEYNSHLLVKGNLYIKSKFVFENGTIETQGDVMISPSFNAGPKTTFLFSGEQKQSLEASDGSNLGNVVIRNYSDDGLYIKNGFQYTSLIDNGCNIIYEDIDGIRGYKLTEDTEFDGTFRLMNGTLDLNGHTLTIHGDFIQEAGILKLNGGTLYVEGDFHLEKRKIVENKPAIYSKSDGQIKIENKDDYLLVEGSFYAKSDSAFNLYKGIVEIKGNINTSSPKNNSYYFENLILSGESEQTIQIQPQYSQIGNLVMKNNSDDGIHIVDSMMKVGKTLTTNETNVNGVLRVGNDVRIVDNAYYGNLEISGSIYCLQNLDIYGNVSGTGKIYIPDKYVYIHGDVSDCSIVMQNNNSQLMIDGIYTITTPITYNKGKIILNGDVYNAGNISIIDTCELVLAGTKKQCLYASEGMSVETLTLLNTSTDGVYFDSVIKVLTFHTNDCKYYMEGLVGVFGWTLQEDTEYNGDLILAGGNLDLNGYNLIVHGNVITNHANITVRNGSFLIDGDFRLQTQVTDGDEISYKDSQGNLIMHHANGRMIVKGNTYLSPQINHSTLLTKGTMYLQGNVTIEELTNTDLNFKTGSDFNVVFDGDNMQQIKTGSCMDIGNLYIENSSPEGITIDGYLGVIKSINDNGHFVHGFCRFNSEISVAGNIFHGNVYLTNERNWRNEELHISGDVYLNNVGIWTPIIVDGNCYIENSVYFRNNFYIKGNCESIENPYSSIILETNGYLQIEGNGNITGINGQGGIAQIDGDLNLKNYQFNDNKDNKIIFGGNKKQYIQVTDAVCFDCIELKNNSQEGVVASNILKYITLIRNGCNLTYEGINGIFGWTLQEDEIIDGDLILLGEELNLNGHSLTITGNFYHCDGTLLINHGKMIIDGDYFITEYNSSEYGKGIINMIYPDDELIIAGNWKVNSVNNSNLLEDGIIKLGGNLTANKNFTLEKKSTLLLNGTIPQSLQINQIANIKNKNTNEVININNSIIITGELDLGNSVFNGIIILAEKASISSGEYRGNVQFSDFILTEDIKIIGNATVLSGKCLDLNSHSLTITGQMNAESYNIWIKNGSLILLGDLYVGNGTAFDCSVQFTGDKKQSIHAQTMAANFKEVIIENTSKDGVLSTDYFKCCSLVDPERKLKFGQNKDYYETGYQLTEDMVITGNYNLGYGVLDLNGYTLTVTGDFNHIGGTIEFHGGTLQIQGTYYGCRHNLFSQSPAYGILSMQDDDDYMVMEYASFYQATGDQYKLLKNGCMEINQKVETLDTTILKNYENHKIILHCNNNYNYEKEICKGKFELSNLTLDTDQKVSINADVKITNSLKVIGENINFKNKIEVDNIDGLYGDIRANVYAVSDSILHHNIKIIGTLSTPYFIDLNGYELDVTNLDLISKYIHTGNDLEQKKGSMHLNQGRALVHASCNIAGQLIMQDDIDYLYVGGTFWCSMKQLTAGTLEIQGDISGTLNTSGSCRIILSENPTKNRTTIQQVNIGKGYTDPPIEYLELRSGLSHYHFSDDVEKLAKNVIYSDDTEIPPVTEIQVVEEAVNYISILIKPADTQKEIVGYRIVRNGETVGSTSGTTYIDQDLTEDTVYEYEVYAFDKWNHETKTSPKIQARTLKDLEAPTIPTNLEVSVVTGKSVILAWNASTDNASVAGYEVYRDGSFIGYTDQLTYEDNNLTEKQTYIYTILAYDKSGNRSELTEDVTVMPLKPQINSVFPVDYSTLNGDKIDISIAFLRVCNNGSYTVSAEYFNPDTNRWVAIASKMPISFSAQGKNLAKTVWDVSDLTEDEYEVRYRVTDSAGCMIEERVIYYMDHTPPACPQNLSAISNHGVISLSWDASISSDCVGYFVYRRTYLTDDEFIKIADIKNHLEETYTDCDTKADTFYEYAICAYDEHGNESAKASTVKAKALVDDVAPVITDMSPRAGRIAGTVSFITSATDNRSLDKIIYYIRYETSGEWLKIGEADVINNYATFSFDSNLYEDGNYFINAVAVDSFGNQSEEEYLRRYEIDNTGISKIIWEEASIYATGVQLRWKDVPEEDFAYFSIERLTTHGYEEIGRSENQLGYNVTGLSSNTEYRFRVVGYDDLGNRGEVSDIYCITTSVDDLPPVIRSVEPIASYYRDYIHLKMNVSDNNAIDHGVFSYSYDGKDYNEIATVYPLKGSRQACLSADFDVRSLPEGNIYIRFEVYDTSGMINYVPDGKNAIENVYCIDHTAPEAPTGLTGTQGDGYVLLTWIAPQAKDIASYKLYRADIADGVFREITRDLQSSNYYDTTTIVNHAYRYKIVSVDIAGNVSEESNECTASCSKDKTAPIIYSVSPASNSVIGAHTTLQTAVSDNTKVSTVYFCYRKNESAWVTIGEQEVNRSYSFVNQEWDMAEEEGNYEVGIWCTDSSGNKSNLYLCTYYVDRTPPKGKLSARGDDFCIHIDLDNQTPDDYDHMEIYRKALSIGEGNKNHFSKICSTTDTSYIDQGVIPFVLYEYKAILYDSHGNSQELEIVSAYATDTDRISPTAVAPEQMRVIEGMEIALDGGESYDNVKITSYEWSIQGETKKGRRIKHIFEKSGDYEVILTVTDAAGNSSKTYTQVKVLQKQSTGVVQVQITDENGSPIPYAHVYMSDSADSKIAYKADGLGQITLAAQVGSYKIAAYKSGYIPKDIEVTVSRYETKRYTLSIPKGDLVVGDIKISRMTMEEMLEEGVDLTAPDNLNQVKFEISLGFTEQPIPVKKTVIKNGSNQNHTSSDTEFLPPEGNGGGSGGGTGDSSGNGGSGGNADIDIKLLEVENEETELPLVAYVRTTQTVSWLKDMYMVELGVLNAADSQYVIEDASASIVLPDGLSLATTNPGQSAVISMDTIAGQEKKYATWVVRADKPGHYEISAGFKGTLLPFGCPVNATFKAEQRINREEYKDVIITIQPEKTAYRGEDYYIQFEIANESEFPLYMFSASFGTYQEAETKKQTTLIDTLHDTTIILDDEKQQTIDYSFEETEQSLVLQGNQKLLLEELPAKSAVRGTYIGNLEFTDGYTTENPELVYYELAQSMVRILEGQELGVTIQIEPIDGHIQKDINVLVPEKKLFGDPIDVTTGSYVDTLELLSVSGDEILSFDLNYNSDFIGKGSSEVGNGYYHNFETKLVEESGMICYYVNPYVSLRFANEDSLKGIYYGSLQDNKIVLKNYDNQEDIVYRALTPGLESYRLLRHKDGSYTLQKGDGSICNYDTDGLLTSMIQENGAEIEITRTHTQMIISEIKSGCQLVASYSDGRIVSVTDHTGRIAKIAYTGENLSTITNPLGEHMTYTYDKNNRLTQGVNHVGNIYVENAYDSNGRIIKQTDSNGNTSTFTYQESENGYTIDCIDANQNHTRIGCDTNQKINCIEQPSGETINYRYDDYGNMIYADSSSGIAYTYTYDEKNNMTGSFQDGQEIKLAYDESGRIVNITDPIIGQSMIINYDESGKITDVKGTNTHYMYTYTDQGKLASMTEEGIGTTSYTYDSTGCNLTGVTDARGNTTNYTYDDRGNILSESDPCGNTITYTYDAANRKISETDALGAQTKITYDWYGNVESKTDALGNVTQYQYNTAGQLTKVIYADGGKECYTYDALGNCRSITNRAGLTTEFVYDVYGNQTEVLYPNGTRQSYIYDIYGRVTESTDIYGNKTGYSYDSFDRLVQLTTAEGKNYITAYDRGTSNPVSVINQSKEQTYVYDNYGNLLNSTDVLGNVVSYTYNSHNQVKTSVDANGNQTRYSYDAMGNCTEIKYPDGTAAVMSYDACNRLVKTSIGNVTETYAYDKAGNLDSYTDASGNETTYIYDKNQRLIQVYNAAGICTESYTYDVVGRKSTETDAAGIITSYQYNSFDLPETVTQSAPNGQSRSYEYAYDTYGNLTSVTAPDGTTASQSFDAFGNITQVTNPMGGTASYTYDNYGRLTLEALSNGVKTSYTYDQDGHPVTYTNGRGGKTEYTYDAAGRLTEQKDEDGTIGYTYDANGNILRITETGKDGTTQTITRTYDSRNRVTSVTDYRGETVKYGYDELGNRISLTYAGGEIVRYTYQPNGLMESMVDDEGYQTSYTYDSLGQIQTVVKPDGSTESYAYDNAGKLTRHEIKASGKTVACNEYTYDVWGNISTIISTEDTETPEPQVLTMTYDTSNRMLTVNGEEVHYDADGNMTYGLLNGTMTEFTYDSRNRLIQAGNIHYEYDAEDVRTAVITPDYREDYTVDREATFSQVLSVSRTYVAGTKEETTYYYGNGLVYEKKTGTLSDDSQSHENTTLQVYHFNHLGSTICLTDKTGAVTNRFNYGTYGELLTADKAVAVDITRFLYNGEYGVQTDANGLYYMRSRYYSPEIRRFINQDVVTGSINQSASLNRYSYVEGNPVSYTDPFGLSPYQFISKTIHIGLDVVGIFVPGANVINALYYFAEGNIYGGVESLIFSLAGGALGKGFKYAAAGGKTFTISAETIAAITQGSRGLAAGLAANDVGQGIAGMIEDYGIDGKDISERTILEVLGILASGAQMGAYGNAFANGFAGVAGVSGSEGKSESSKNTATTIDYSYKFDRELANFNDGYEIRTTVDKDLILVQYSSDAPDASLCYWTTVDEANGITTLNDYMDKLALSKDWGNRNTVKVARIPAGTEVKYAVGTAREQLSIIDPRPGGGVQYLFNQFDTDWITEIRCFSN